MVSLLNGIIRQIRIICFQLPIICPYEVQLLLHHNPHWFSESLLPDLTAVSQFFAKDRGHFLNGKLRIWDRFLIQCDPRALACDGMCGLKYYLDCRYKENILSCFPFLQTECLWCTWCCSLSARSPVSQEMAKGQAHPWHGQSDAAQHGHCWTQAVNDILDF